MERRPLALAAIVAASVTLAAGCGSKTAGQPQTAPATTAAGAAVPAAASATPTTAATPAPPAPAYDATVPTVSDGSATVLIDHRAVTFPSTVTDAAWSPNGTRLAYVDGTGNIAVANPDGTHVQELTKGSGIKRARVAWDGGQIAFAELKNGAWTLREVALPYDDFGGADAHNETDWAWAGDPSDAQKFSAASSPSVMAQGAPASRVYGGLEYAAQQDNGAQHKVYVFDRNLRGNTGNLTFDGTDPALSPDGSQVVFVGKNGQLEVAQTDYPEHVAKPAAPRQITFGADHPSHPAWSADGSRIAFETSHDVESVASSVTTGATSNPSRQESAKPGVPTYQNLGAVTVQAFTGSDPVGAAIALSQVRFATAKSALDFGGPMPADPGEAVLVASDSDAGAAAAEQIGGQGGGEPMLFTSAGSLDPRVTVELNRLFGPCLQDKKQYDFCSENRPTLTVVGTEKEIPAAVVNQLKAMGFQITRVTAADPHDLSIANPNKGSSVIYVVDPADHAAAAAAAHAAAGGALVLTNGANLTAAARTYLNSVKDTNSQGPIPVYAVGKNAAAALSAAGFPGKRAFKVTTLTGDSPAAELETLLGYREDNPTDAVLVPANSSVALFADSSFVIPVGTDSKDVTALLQYYGSVLTTFTAFDDPSPYLVPLQTGIGAPAAIALAPVHAAS